MSDRFSRHDLIPGWNQAALSEATVIVVGVGALGNEVSRLLAMAGVGRLIICDPDLIEESNLSRTSLFSQQDTGRPKVEAARDALQRLVPTVSVQTRFKPHVHGIGLGELRDAGIVLSCLDSRTSRLQLSGRCSLVRAGWIDGGTNPWGGEVRPFLDPDGPCYGCLLSASQRAEADVPVSCHAPTVTESMGASAGVSAIVGSWMATLAFRRLMSLDVPSHSLRIDTEAAATTSVHLQKSEDCPFHEPVGEVRRIPIGSDDSAGLLRTHAGSGAPVLWEPVIHSARCSRCGMNSDVWRPAASSTCPNCGSALSFTTTLELNLVPDAVPLHQLGLPPREIVPVKNAGTWTWLELRD